MTSTNQQLRTEITTMACDMLELKVTDLELDKSPVDYDLDSIKVVKFIRRVNEHFGVNVKMGKVLSVDDFEGLFTIFEKAIADK